MLTLFSHLQLEIRYILDYSTTIIAYWYHMLTHSSFNKAIESIEGCIAIIDPNSSQWKPEIIRGSNPTYVYTLNVALPATTCKIHQHCRIDIQSLEAKNIASHSLWLDILASSEQRINRKYYGHITLYPPSKPPKFIPNLNSNIITQRRFKAGTWIPSPAKILPVVLILWWNR